MGQGHIPQVENRFQPVCFEMPPKKGLRKNSSVVSNEEEDNCESECLPSTFLPNIGSELNTNHWAEQKRFYKQNKLCEKHFLRESIHSFEEEKINRECTDRATILKELKDELKGLRERLVLHLFLFLFIIYCDFYVDNHVVYREILCCLVCPSTMKHSKSLQLLVLRRLRCK